MRSFVIAAVLVALTPTTVVARDYKFEQPLLVKDFLEPYAEKAFRNGRTVCVPTNAEQILCKVKHQYRPRGLSARRTTISYTVIQNDMATKMWVKALASLR